MSASIQLLRTDKGNLVLTQQLDWPTCEWIHSRPISAFWQDKWGMWSLHGQKTEKKEGDMVRGKWRKWLGEAQGRKRYYTKWFPANTKRVQDLLMCTCNGKPTKRQPCRPASFTNERLLAAHSISYQCVLAATIWGSRAGLPFLSQRM